MAVRFFFFFFFFFFVVVVVFLLLFFVFFVFFFVFFLGGFTSVGTGENSGNHDLECEKGVPLHCSIGGKSTFI